MRKLNTYKVIIEYEDHIDINYILGYDSDEALILIKALVNDKSNKVLNYIIEEIKD